MRSGVIWERDGGVVGHALKTKVTSREEIGQATKQVRSDSRARVHNRLYQGRETNGANKRERRGDRVLRLSVSNKCRTIKIKQIV